MANASYVSVGKPLVGGSIYRAPAGTTLPTDATTALGEAFKELGYISEDGLVNANTAESTEIKDWGGLTVLTPFTNKSDRFTFTPIEALNIERLKAIYGDSNVSGTLATGITVNVNADEPEEAVYVVEILLNGGYVERIVVPRAMVAETGELTFKRDTPIGQQITLAALPDSAGQTHYIYIAKP